MCEELLGGLHVLEHDLFEHATEHLGEQSVAILEVLVDEGHRDLGLGGDILDAQSEDALDQHFVAGGLDDPLARSEGPTGDGGNGGRVHGQKLPLFSAPVP